MSQSLSRRTMLRGMIGGVAAALALPTLDIMLNANGTAYADGTPIPKRFGVWFWGNGVLPVRFVPRTNGANWWSGGRDTVPDQLKPFFDTGVLPDMSIVTGLQCKHGPAYSTSHHAEGVIALSSAPSTEVPYSRKPTAPSIDQVVASEWEGKTSFRSLEVAISRRMSQNTRVDYSGCSYGPARIPAERSPLALFNRIFSMGSGSASAAEAERASRSHARILDVVAADARALRNRLGAVDRVRLDHHLASVEAVEARLRAKGSACTIGAPPAAEIAEVSGKEAFEENHAAMAGVLALALACDLTRVFSVTFTHEGTDSVFSQVGASEGLHTLTHDEGTVDESTDGVVNSSNPYWRRFQPTVHKTVMFTMTQFAKFIRTFRDTPDGAGNLLDNSCIYGTSELTSGYSHGHFDMPTLIAGRAGGALKSGIHYRSPNGEQTSSAQLTMLRALGLSRAEWGVDSESMLHRTSSTIGAIQNA